MLLILRLIFGVNLPDSNAPFRLMRRELVEKYIHKLPENFNLPNVMFTTYFVYFHEKVKFENISFKPRQGGGKFYKSKENHKNWLECVGRFLQAQEIY